VLKKNVPKYFPLVLIFALFLLPPNSSHGYEGRDQDCLKCHSLSNDEARDLLKGVFPNVKILDVKISPSRSLWEVFLEAGGRKGLIYIDLAKKHLISGSMILIKEKKNLTQERFAELNKIDVSQVPLDDALVMGDPQAIIRVIVFDDPD
jgi:thiol:disulfide interchange protein DsbC